MKTSMVERKKTIKKLVKKKVVKKTTSKKVVKKNPVLKIVKKKSSKIISKKSKIIPLKKKVILKKQILKKNITKPKKIKVLKSKKNILKKKITPKKNFKKINTKNTKKKVVVKKSNKKNIKVFKNKAKLVEAKMVLELERNPKNPILSPNQNFWESEAVFNPGALYLDDKVHIFYRAMGPDGISRIGYAISNDGVNFQRLSYPVFSLQNFENLKIINFTSPARRVFDPKLYGSGGGWGGAEDPRVVCIDDIVYITLNIFNGWHSLRVAVLSISKENLLKQNWEWEKFTYLSHDFDRQKNWVLFPEKINNKFLIFHNLDMNNNDINTVGITETDIISSDNMPFGDLAPDPQRLPDRIVAWHKRTRSAACPPIKTKDGWLVLYHAMDKDGSDRYKLGAMLLDLNNPKKVLYRALNPILESKEWYENDYKPGVIYASGAVVIGRDLFVYYGGGDKRVNVATINLALLLESMKNNKEIKLNKINKK